MSMGDSQATTSGKLRQALYESIANALSTDIHQRQQAEQRIKALEVTDEYGLYLCEIALMKTGMLAVRQMASILLKQYIMIDKDNDPVHHSRLRIKPILINGLAETEIKIRNIFCYCIAYMYNLDWPNEWPELISKLHEKVESRTEHQVSAALRVVADILRMRNLQKLEVLSLPILDLLCCIIEDDKHYNMVLQTEAIGTLDMAVTILMDSFNDNVKDSIMERVPRLCNVFMTCLQLFDYGVLEFNLKTSIMKFITTLMINMSVQILPQLKVMLPVIWSLVTKYGELYIRIVLTQQCSATEFEDAEGKVMGFIPLVLGIFDFINTLVELKELNTILLDVLPDITYYIIIFIQIPRKVEILWMQDPVKYLEFYSGDSFETIVRISALNMCKCICHEFNEESVMMALCVALNRHIAEAEERKNDGSNYWLKINESCMQTLTIAKNIIINCYRDGSLQFNLLSYLEYWQACFSHISQSILTGCITWFTGNYSPILTRDQFNYFLQQTMNALQNGVAIDKICAVKSLKAFCQEFSMNPHGEVLIVNLGLITDGLLEIITSIAQPNCLMILTLKTLDIVLRIDKLFMIQMCSRVTHLLNYLFTKYNSDPLVMHEVKIMLKHYCEYDTILEHIQDKFVPIVSNVLSMPVDRAPSGSQVVAMELLLIIIKYCKPPPREVLVAVGFSSAVKCIIATDDQLLMQIGGDSMRYFLLLGAQEVCNYVDTEGKTGLEYLLQAIGSLLDPSNSEEACRRVGRLIITLLGKVGPVLGPQTDMLLRGILSKMQRADNREVWESLLMVFAYLFYTEIEAVVNFLSSIPGPTGVSALEFVLNQWINRHTPRINAYERIINLSGLCNLIEYTMLSNQEYLEKVMITDKLLPKAFKLLIADLEYHLKLRSTLPDPDSDSGSHSNSESEDESPILIHLSHDMEQCDPFYAFEPVFQIDVFENVKTFFSKFETFPIFREVYGMLTQREKTIISCSPGVPNYIIRFLFNKM